MKGKNRKPLKTLFHMDEQQFHQEYERRIHAPNTIHVPLMIHGKPAFIEQTAQMNDLLQKIVRLNRQITNQIPEIWNSNKTIQALILEEMNMSLSIEGIEDEKAALQKALKYPEDPSLPFAGFAAGYRKLYTDSQLQGIHQAKDIRRIYDGILLPDIVREDPANAPDGEAVQNESR